MTPMFMGKDGSIQPNSMINDLNHTEMAESCNQKLELYMKEANYRETACSSSTISN